MSLHDATRWVVSGCASAGDRQSQMPPTLMLNLESSVAVLLTSVHCQLFMIVQKTCLISNTQRCWGKGALVSLRRRRSQPLSSCNPQQKPKRRHFGISFWHHRQWDKVSFGPWAVELSMLSLKWVGILAFGGVVARKRIFLAKRVCFELL